MVSGKYLFVKSYNYMEQAQKKSMFPSYLNQNQTNNIFFQNYQRQDNLLSLFFLKNVKYRMVVPDHQPLLNRTFRLENYQSFLHKFQNFFHYNFDLLKYNQTRFEIVFFQNQECYLAHLIRNLHLLFSFLLAPS